MQPVMIQPREEEATATRKHVLTLHDPLTPDRSQQVGRHRALVHLHHDLPVTAHMGIAPLVPLATDQWVTAHRDRLGIVRSATAHPDRLGIVHTLIAHHVPLVTDQPVTVNHLATVPIPLALQANAHR
jgi:hypothetical protein